MFFDGLVSGRCRFSCASRLSMAYRYSLARVDSRRLEGGQRDVLCSVAIFASTGRSRGGGWVGGLHVLAFFCGYMGDRVSRGRRATARANLAMGDSWP